MAAEPEPWWEVVDNGTTDGVSRAMCLGETLRAFAANVEVDGAEGGGQLATKLGNMDGEEGWRLGLVKLVKQDQVPEIQAVCVVLNGKARRRAQARCSGCEH